MNNNDQIKQKITFVYAIKDSLFKLPEERTKFFDYIIPIIPHVNSANAEATLYKKLDLNHKDNNELLRQIIDNISIYIQDNRIVNSILNEYEIYEEKLTDIKNEITANDKDNKTEKEKIIKSKIFAMICYKILCPEDFHKLLIGKSVLNEIIDKKKEYKKLYIESLEEKIQDFTNDTFESLVKEHRRKYITELAFKTTPHSGSRLYFNGSNYYSFKDLLENDLFETWIERDTIIVGNHSASFNEIQKIIEEVSYKRSLINIGLQIDFNDKEAKKISSKLNNVNTVTLKDLLNINEINNKILNDYKKHKLLITLLRYGYVGEDYNFYINHFRPGSLSIDDRDFIMKIKSGETPTNVNFDFETSISNPKKVIEKLKHDLKNPYCFNHNMLEHLFENSQTEKFTFIVNKILQSNFFKEVIEYISKKEDYSSDLFQNIIKIFIKNDNDLWVRIENISGINSPQKIEYLKLILCSIDKDCYDPLNRSDSFKSYLTHSIDLLSFDELLQSQESIIALVDFLDIKFTKPKSTDSLNIKLKDVFTHIYENNRYELETYIVNVIIHYFEVNDFSPYYLDHKKSEDLSHLINYIDSNINDYVSNIYLEDDSSNTVKNGEIKWLLHVLNNEYLKPESANEIINTKKFTTNIDEFEKDDDKLTAIENNRIEPTWTNIEKYYVGNKKQIDDAIVGFINVNYQPPSYKPLINTLKELETVDLEYEGFVNELVTHDNINHKVLIEILNHFDEDLSFYYLENKVDQEKELNTYIQLIPQEIITSSSKVSNYIIDLYLDRKIDLDDSLIRKILRSTNKDLIDVFTNQNFDKAFIQKNIALLHERERDYKTWSYIFSHNRKKQIPYTDREFSLLERCQTEDFMVANINTEQKTFNLRKDFDSISIKSIYDKSL
ncbi:hypothetical protein IC221_01130 [Flammeovirga sp. EKP202]|nr:hypothetical protein [Flammeovirga sp. EKP202]MBD0399958.1 hypothetical protein [Flammeovirga sp. EKP202]